MKAILGKKVGMTQIFAADGRIVPVTAIEAGPCVIVQKKTVQTDGYNAIQVGFGAIKEKKVIKPLKGHLAKSNAKAVRHLREFTVDNVDEFQLGQELKADVFTEGDHVDVIGITKGKGFAGPIKRHGFHRGPMKHGSKYHRHGGSLGAKGPARVMPGHKMPGHMGVVRRTVQNLEIVRVDTDKNLILVKGAIPGPNRGLVTIKTTVKNVK